LPFPCASVNFKERSANIPGTGDELVSGTSTDDIGRYTAAILKHPEITKNTIIRVAGDTVTSNGVLAKAEKKLGTKFQVTRRSAEEIDQVAQEGLKSGNLGAYFMNRIPLFAGTGVCLLK
jgi:NmrA-like family